MSARRAALAVAFVVTASAAVALLGAIGWPASAYRDGDFTQYWIQPQALIEDRDPYDGAWWAAAHERAGQRPESPQAVYPPHDAIVFLPLAALPLSYAAAAWIVAQLAAVAAALVLVGARVPRAERGVFFGLAVSFQPLWLLPGGANITGFLFAAFATAFVAALDHRPVRCGAFLGLLIVKPQAFAFLAAAVLVIASWRERRALAQLARGALSTAGPLIALTFALRPAWYGEWIGSAIGLAGSPRSNATVWTLDRVAGLPSASGPVVAALAITAFAAWAWRTRPTIAMTMALGIPVSLAVAPYGWSYDQLQLLITLAVGLAAAATLAPRARAAALVALAVVAVPLPWSLYVLAFQRGGEELSVLTPLLTFGLVVALTTLGRRARPVPQLAPARAGPGATARTELIQLI
jgi:glycosyl transferase family 87